MTTPIDSQLSDLVRSDKVVLFMKGNRQFPQCGFSATVVGILDQLVPSYKTVNVLSDPAIRDGIKVYSKWPTIPQLYVNGEFVGGCDIIRDMFEAGELQTLLGVQPALSGGSAKIPKVTVSEAAAKAFKDAAEGPEDHPRVQISAKFEYELFLDKKEKGDIEAEAAGLTFLFDAASARRADGMSIDFVTGEGGGGFKIENPQEPPKVRPLSPKALQELLKKGEKLEMFDVRTPDERATAKIEPSRLLDDPGQDYLAELPRDTTLVFYCHHGIRSRAAAEHFLREGFKKIYNLEGGIDAWSKTIDPSVPKY